MREKPFDCADKGKDFFLFAIITENISPTEKIMLDVGEEEESLSWSARATTRLTFVYGLDGCRGYIRRDWLFDSYFLLHFWLTQNTLIARDSLVCVAHSPFSSYTASTVDRCTQGNDTTTLLICMFIPSITISTTRNECDCERRFMLWDNFTG